jgi:hypothetical protein
MRNVDQQLFAYIELVNHGSITAGNDITFTTFANSLTELIAFQATLDTNATVADRLVTLLIDDGTRDAILVNPVTVQTANTVLTYIGNQAQPKDTPAGAAFTQLCLPPMIRAPENWTIQTNTAGLQGGDQFIQVKAVYRRWPNNYGP